jgi:hypothetical protein
MGSAALGARKRCPPPAASAGGQHTDGKPRDRHGDSRHQAAQSQSFRKAEGVFGDIPPYMVVKTTHDSSTTVKIENLDASAHGFLG